MARGGFKYTNFYKAKISGENMTEEPLKLDKMMELAERVPQWGESSEVTDFNNLSSESLCFLNMNVRLFNPLTAYWDYEGQVDNLRILLDFSAEKYLQIGVLNGEEFIGCSSRLRESKVPELVALYNRIDREVITRIKKEKEEKRNYAVKQGLDTARNLLR